MRRKRKMPLGALVYLVMAACSHDKVQEAETAVPAPANAASPTAIASPSSPSSPSSRYARPPPARVVAIGDLHGDLDAARRALRLAGAIDDKDAWVGGPLMIVQTGDEIDRGDDDRAILDLFEKLQKEAQKTGGDVIALVGNHEIMNASLDFRYVTDGAYAPFDDVGGSDASGPRAAAIDARARHRAGAFFPTGRYATLLAHRPVIARVGDTVFVHGGVLPKHVRYGLDRIDEEVHDWLVGKRSECPPIVTSEDGPVWTRMYSAAPGREECGILDDTLKALGAKRMVVGHTVQRNGINSACGDGVWRIDTGMSKAYGGKIEVLEIQGDVVTVRHESGR